jgi:hypothetical protein
VQLAAVGVEGALVEAGDVLQEPGRAGEDELVGWSNCWQSRAAASASTPSTLGKGHDLRPPELADQCDQGLPRRTGAQPRSATVDHNCGLSTSWVEPLTG